MTMSIVHDNIIQSYLADYETDTLTIKTLRCTDKIKEKTNVIFAGYLAHTFDTAMKDSIIFDIQEYPLNSFLREELNLISKQKCFGWPVLYETENELVEFFQTHGYKVFEISSSYGLCGWVFAKQMIVSRKDATGTELHLVLQ